MQKITHSDKLQTQLTLKIQQQTKYLKLLDWFKQNGGILHQSVVIPAVFGEFAYTGVATSEQIPAKKAFIAVPERLLISTESVRASTQLAQILEENSDFFEAGGNSEQAKHLKEKSFWQPYFDAIDTPVTIRQWTLEEIQSSGDRRLLQRANEYLTELEDTWLTFQQIVHGYPKIFTQGKIAREDFYWAFEFVMTRSFGASVLPMTYLAPVADFLNHAKSGAQYFLVNREFEKDDKQVAGYKKKQGILDISILECDQSSQLQEEKIAQNQNNALVASQQQKLKTAQEIRIQLEQNQKSNIWELEVESSSDEEAGDSEEEEDELQENREQLMRLRAQEATAVGDENFDDYAKKQFKNTRKYLEDLHNDDYAWRNNAQQNYILFTNTFDVQGGEQLYLCYGRRSNRFLLLWYGFCLPRNPYDSLPFRLYEMASKQNSLDLKIIIDYITQKQWEGDELSEKQCKELFGGVEVAPSELTKKFRLKQYKINSDLLTFLRVKLSKMYKLKVLYTYPTNIDLELACFEFIQKLLDQVQDAVRREHKESQVVGAQEFKTYCCNLLRESNVQIIESCQLVIKAVIDFLRQFKKGNVMNFINFKKLYLSQLLKERTSQGEQRDFEDWNSFQIAKALRHYLRDLSVVMVR